MSTENNKRIAKNVLILYIRMFFVMGISFYSFRFVLRNLGVEDYGIYNVVGSVVVLFSFLSSAIITSTQRYLTFELGRENTYKLKQIFGTSMQIHILIALIILFVSEIVGMWFLYFEMVIPVERFNAAFWVFQLSLLSSIITIMSYPYSAVIIAHEKMSVYAYFSMFEVVLKFLAAFVLVFFITDRLIMYAVLLLFIALVIRIIYTIYCRRSFQECRFNFSWNPILFKEMSAFAGWNILGNMSAVAYSQGINMLLNVYFGPVVNAARGIVVQVDGALKQFSTNFQLAMNPQITKSYAQQNLEYMHSLINRSSKFSFLLLFFVSLPLLFETHRVLLWWLGEVPDHTVYFLRLILLASIIDATANPLMIAVQATGNVKKYQIIVGGILLMILPLSYVGLQIVQWPEIVFVIHLLVVIFAWIVRLLIVKSLISLSIRMYFKDVVSRILIVSILTPILPGYIYFSMPDSMLRFFLLWVVSICCVSVISFFVALNMQEKVWVKFKINSFCKRFR